MLEARHRRGDRDAALVLDRHPIRAHPPPLAARLDLSRQLDRPAKQQQFLGQRGLAGVRMRNDRKGAPTRNLVGKITHHWGLNYCWLGSSPVSDPAGLSLRCGYEERVPLCQPPRLGSLQPEREPIIPLCFTCSESTANLPAWLQSPPTISQTKPPGARSQNPPRSAPSMARRLIHHRIRHEAGDSKAIINRSNGPQPPRSTASGYGSRTRRDDRL